MVKVPDSLLGVMFFIGGVVLFIAGWNMAGLGGLAVGPGLMPMIIAAGFVIFGTALVIQGLPELRMLREGRARLLTPRPNPWFPITVLGALVVYVPLLSMVGFVPLTFVFVALIVRASRASLLSSMIFSAAITAFIYMLFVYVLRVPLPMGILG